MPDLPELPPPRPGAGAGFAYRIGAGDGLNIFVWRYPEFTATVKVRPDGKVSCPMVEDVEAAGRTPAELAREIERRLSRTVREAPVVVVMVTEIVGSYAQHVRLLGEVGRQEPLVYTAGMTLLDAILKQGGLTFVAAGNRAVLVRTVDGADRRYRLRLDDLVRKGDVSANVDLEPGDRIFVPAREPEAEKEDGA